MAKKANKFPNGILVANKTNMWQKKPRQKKPTPLYMKVREIFSKSRTKKGEKESDHENC